MSILSGKNWTSGAGKSHNFEQIVEQISFHSKKNKKIFIGSDSFVTRRKVCFVTAVCLLTERAGGRYFFIKRTFR